MISRELQQEVRASADQGSDQLARVPRGRVFEATVATVTAGAAGDGNALVKVRWRDSELTVSGYSAGYTPGVGHRVRCTLTDDNKLYIDYRIVGYP